MSHIFACKPLHQHSFSHLHTAAPLGSGGRVSSLAGDVSKTRCAPRSRCARLLLAHLRARLSALLLRISAAALLLLFHLGKRLSSARGFRLA